MCQSPLVVRNLTPVSLCDTSEQLSPPHFRRRFSRPLRHPQTRAGVVVDISLGTAAMLRMVAITAAVDITVVAPALSVASLSVRWPSRRYHLLSLGPVRAHRRRRRRRLTMVLAMAPRLTDTALLLRPVVMTSSTALRQRSKDIISNMGHRLAMPSSTALHHASKAITSNMGRRLAMDSNTGRRRRGITTATEADAARLAGPRLLVRDAELTARPQLAHRGRIACCLGAPGYNQCFLFYSLPPALPLACLRANGVSGRRRSLRHAYVAQAGTAGRRRRRGPPNPGRQSASAPKTVRWLLSDRVFDTASLIDPSESEPGGTDPDAAPPARTRARRGGVCASGAGQTLATSPRHS